MFFFFILKKFGILSLGLLDTNRSTNLGQTTGPNDNQSELRRPGRTQCKIERKQKER